MDFLDRLIRGGLTLIKSDELERMRKRGDESDRKYQDAMDTIDKLRCEIFELKRGGAPKKPKPKPKPKGP